MPFVHFKTIAPVAVFVLVAQAANLVGHFAAIEHTISEQSGRLSHADPCEAEHAESERPAFVPGCADGHEEHECTVWTLLSQTIEVEATTFVVPAPPVYAVAVDVQVSAPAQILAYAPKQSPPVRS